MATFDGEALQNFHSGFRFLRRRRPDLASRACRTDRRFARSGKRGWRLTGTGLRTKATEVDDPVSARSRYPHCCSGVSIGSGRRQGDWCFVLPQTGGALDDTACHAAGAAPSARCWGARSGLTDAPAPRLIRRHWPQPRVLSVVGPPHPPFWATGRLFVRYCRFDELGGHESKGAPLAPKTRAETKLPGDHETEEGCHAQWARRHGPMSLITVGRVPVDRLRGSRISSLRHPNRRLTHLHRPLGRTHR